MMSFPAPPPFFYRTSQVSKCNVPSYSSWGIFCCFSYYPVDDHIEKKSRHHTSLSNSCFYFKPDVAMPYTASEIVVETVYKLDDLF